MCYTKRTSLNWSAETQIIEAVKKVDDLYEKINRVQAVATDLPALILRYDHAVTSFYYDSVLRALLPQNKMVASLSWKHSGEGGGGTQQKSAQKIENHEPTNTFYIFLGTFLIE